jgi:hypothetical protein
MAITHYKSFFAYLALKSLFFKICFTVFIVAFAEFIEWFVMILAVQVRTRDKSLILRIRRYSLVFFHDSGIALERGIFSTRVAAEVKLVNRSGQRVFNGLAFAIQDRLRTFPFVSDNSITRTMRIPATVDLEVAAGLGKGLEMIFGQKKTSSENV